MNFVVREKSSQSQNRSARQRILALRDEKNRQVCLITGEESK